MDQWLWVWVLIGCGSTGDEPPPSPDHRVPTSDPTTPTPPDRDGDGWHAGEDCDDDDPSVFPGAPDVCGDFRVTDCNRTSDDGLITVDGTASFTDLQRALDAAAEGSSILVCPGTYVGPFEASRTVHLEALARAEATTLRGDGLGPALSVVGGTVDGFTLRGGSADRGGGLLQTAPGSLSVIRCRVTANRAYEGAGIALAEGGYAAITDSTIFGNEASPVAGEVGSLGGGGGILVPSGAFADLTGSTVERNTAYYGGGVLVDGGVLLGGLLTGNTSLASGGDHPGGGGGLTTLGVSEVVGVEISNNLAGVHGGGFSVVAGSVATFTDVRVHDNYADIQGGGGLVASGSDLTLLGTSEVRANEAGYDGGGVVVRDAAVLRGGVVLDNLASAGGGVSVASDGAVVDTRIEGNIADSTAGGVWINQGRLERVVIAGNMAATSGGGVASASGEVRLLDVTILDNVAPNGGGLYSSGPTTVVQLVGGTLHRNLGETGGGAYLLGRAEIRSTDTDWGVGDDDNDPPDVYAADDHHPYGAGATFLCTRDGCTPEAPERERRPAIGPGRRVRKTSP